MLRFEKGPSWFLELTNQILQGHWGVTRGGAVDPMAASWVEYLLENSSDMKVFELFGVGHRIQVEEDCIGALVGPEIHVTVNDIHWPNWSSTRLSRGDCIEIKSIGAGMWSYLGVVGSDSLHSPRKRLTDEIIPRYDFKIRFLPASDVPAEILERFLNAQFKKGREFNRMGIRLDGDQIKHDYPSGQSEALALGTIQLPAGGRPIILGPEHQTIGGYLRVGQVYPFDLGKLFQASPEGTIAFEVVDLEALRELYRNELMAFHYP